MINLNAYKQGDSKWSQTVMKPGTLNLGQAGCLVTSCAMALSNFAITVTPGELCEKLSAISGFDQYSNLILNKPAQLWPSVSFIDRFRTSLWPMSQDAKIEITEAIRRITRLIQIGIPVALNVDSTPKDKVRDPNHWVIAFDAQLNDFTIIDPIDGKTLQLSSRYDYADKAIYGYTAWMGAPISFPNADKGGEPQDGIAAWKLSQAMKGIAKDMYIREAFESLINNPN